MKLFNLIVGIIGMVVFTYASGDMSGARWVACMMAATLSLMLFAYGCNAFEVDRHKRGGER